MFCEIGILSTVFLFLSLSNDYGAFDRVVLDFLNNGNELGELEWVLSFVAS